MKRKQKTNSKFAVKAICVMLFILGLNCIEGTERQELGECLYNCICGIALILAATFAAYTFIIKPMIKEEKK